MDKDLDSEGLRRVIKYHVKPLIDVYCKVVDDDEKMRGIVDDALEK